MLSSYGRCVAFDGHRFSFRQFDARDRPAHTSSSFLRSSSSCRSSSIVTDTVESLSLENVVVNIESIATDMRPRIIIRTQQQQQFTLVHPHEHAEKEKAIIDLTMDEIKAEPISDDDDSRIIVNNEVSLVEKSKSARFPSYSISQITSTISIPASIASPRISKRTLQVHTHASD